MKRCITILLVFLCFLGHSQVQNSDTYTLRTDTLNAAKSFRYLLVPVVFYTPETNFAFGGGTQLFFKPKDSPRFARESSIFGAVIYTLNKQLTVQVKPKIYFKNESFSLDSELKFQIFPNSFWGIGPETPDSLEERYNQTETLIKAALLKRLPNYVNFGFQFTFANFKMTEVAPGGILESGTVDGASGAKLIGLGVVFNIDSRDNHFSPLKGGLYQFKTNFTSKVLGSTHSFNTYIIDLRKYFNLFNNHILAIQIISQYTFGDSPFQAKAIYGGADLARGYFKGRYIDNYLYVAQIEYRLPLFKRWELAFFALTGNVGNDESSLFDDFKSSIGFGPRFFISKHNRSMLRLDISVNSEGGGGIYFGVDEAF